MKSDFSQIIIEGHATHDPEVKETTQGFKICKIPIAVNRSYKNAVGEQTEEVSFFDIETFGKNAENCAKYVQKGQGLRVVGTMKQYRWKSKEGKSMSHFTVLARQVDFMAKKRKSSEEKESELKNLTEVASEIVQEITEKPVF